MTPTEVALRQAGPQDLPAIARIYLAARHAPARTGAMPPLPRPDDQVETHFLGLDLADPARELWVAEADGAVLGWAQLVRDWLEGLYVDPAAQQSGVGSMLLDLAKALRPGGFGLWVFEQNAPARAFYARHGLEELEHTDGSAVEEHAPDVHMVWPGREPLAYLRGLIDEVDDELGGLLARRVALTAAVQRHKPVGGLSGRDEEREREISERVAAKVPGLGVDRVQRIVHTIITESLEAVEEA